MGCTNCKKGWQVVYAKTCMEIKGDYLKKTDYASLLLLIEQLANAILSVQDDACYKNQLMSIL